MSTWKPTADHQRFIRRYSAAIESGDVALFAGAGLSRASGFVDWRLLLKDIAAELHLDVDRETDLIAVAQYHVNAKKNRARINQVLIDELTKDVSVWASPLTRLARSRDDAPHRSEAGEHRWERRN